MTIETAYHENLDNSWWAPFCTILRETGNVRRSCETLNINRRMAFRHKQNYSEFSDMWDDAMADACDTLELIARDRAIESSDRLLMFLLASHRPELYNDSYKVKFVWTINGVEVELTEEVDKLLHDKLASMAKRLTNRKLQEIGVPSS